MKKLFGNRWIKSITFIFLGAVAGFAYYYFIGCNTGTCPITSNPIISTTYGSVVGLLLSFNGKKESERK
jgi:hypothetical protein